MWDVEMVILLRNIIDDVGETPKYTDDRLMQLLLVGAQFTKGENAFGVDYIIDVENYSLTPDPTASVTRDDAFINLTVLRSACLLAGSGLGKAGIGMMVREGSVHFDNRNVGAAKQFQVKTWCSAYAEAKWEFVVNNSVVPGEAIIGPYRSCEYKNNGYAYGLPYTHRDRM